MSLCMTVSMVTCMLIAEQNNESYESVSGLKCVCMCVYMCVCVLIAQQN